MRTRITSLVLGVMTAALLVAAPVAAGDKRVVITLDVNFSTGVEAFTAIGAFCATGSAETTSAYATGRPVFHVDKTFTCEDGSGTMSISLNAAATSTGTSGGWTVKGGTGAWAGVSGGGQITGVNTPTGIQDTYTGSISR